MKKGILLLFIGMVVFHPVKAQTWDEWFRQRKTQRKYLVQQIAALKVYLGYLEKGYDIVNKGLTTIHNIKNGDFNLHRDFFSSLKNVNPAILHLAKVADIMAYQYRIIKDANDIISRASGDPHYSPSEISYIKNVLDHLLDECLKNADALLSLTTHNELEMKDDERIKRIDKIYTDMQDKFSFTQSFGKDIVVLSLKRQSEANDVELSRKLYGIE